MLPSNAAMCDCAAAFIAWHPLWGELARAAGVRRKTVLFAVLYLRAAPDVKLSRDIRTIAAALGNRPERVARVIAALQAAGVVDGDNRPVGEFALPNGSAGENLSRDSVTERDGSVTGHAVTPDVTDSAAEARPIAAAERVAAETEIERIRRLARERQRRKRTRDRAAFGVTAPQEREEKEYSNIDSSCSSLARPEADDPEASGLRPSEARRLYWTTKLQLHAERLLPPEQFAELARRLTQKALTAFIRNRTPLDPWVKGVFEQIDARLRDEALAAKEGRVPTQTELLLPIAGMRQAGSRSLRANAAPAGARLGDIADEGLHGALSGLRASMELRETG